MSAQHNTHPECRCLGQFENCLKCRRKTEPSEARALDPSWGDGLREFQADLRNRTRILKLLSTGFLGAARTAKGSQKRNNSKYPQSPGEFSTLLRFLRSREGHNSQSPLLEPRRKGHLTFVTATGKARVSPQQHHSCSRPEHSGGGACPTHSQMFILPGPYPLDTCLSTIPQLWQWQVSQTWQMSPREQDGARGKPPCSGKPRKSTTDQLASSFNSWLTDPFSK